MDGIYFEITVIICLASVLTILFRFFKQPPVLAYILTGILLGPAAGGFLGGIVRIQSGNELATLGQLGITLLLFMLGLELKLRDLHSIGKTAALAGSIQVIATFFFGSLLGLLLGLHGQSAVYIGIAVAFSSTIMIVKLLSDKKDLNSLHGKLAIGMLLVQDFFAIMTLIFFSGLHDSTNMLFQMVLVGLKVLVIFGWILVLSKYVFPFIIHKVARSQESLFLFSLAWVFALTAFVTSPLIGFSIEIGGFLAGLSLANATENFQIVAKMRSLRDFFVTIFFVFLGIEMNFQNALQMLLPALVISVFVLVGKPVIVMGVTGFLGFRKRTSFITGVNLAQLSEFSLIILFMGNRIHAIPESVVTLGILVALITFVVSTYMIVHVNMLYGLLNNHLSNFERKHPHNGGIILEHELADMHNHVVVVGAAQMGESILHALKRSKEEVIVIEFDPDIASSIKTLDVPVVFGDIADPEIQERARIEKARIVISTVSDLEDNLLLINAVKQKNKRALIIVVALEDEDAKALYAAGANYVVLPELAGGRHLAKMLLGDRHMELIEEYKAKDLAVL